MPQLPVITVIETFAGRGMTFRFGGEAEYTRTFYATSDIVTDPQAVVLADGIPRPGDFYTTAQGGVDVRATCREVTPRQRSESPKEWEVTCHYSSRSEPSRAGGTSGASDTGGSPAEAAIQNPLLKPTQIQPGTKKYTRPAEIDVTTGDPIVNAAGRKFDPPLMEECINGTLTITRNLATLDFTQFTDLQNVINSKTYLGYAPRKLKVDSLDATYTYEAGVYFWAVRCVLEVAPFGETWVRRVLNCGFDEVVFKPAFGGVGPPQKKVVPIMIDGQRPSTPWPLTPDGRAIREDTNAKPNFLQVQTNYEADFALLRLF